MIGQQLKTVVSIGGAVDGSFQKIGATFEKTMGQATRSVKDLEREQDSLTRSIKRSEKAAAQLASVESENAASVSASQKMVAQREAMTRTINIQSRALKRLDNARESTTDAAELTKLNSRREELVQTLESERTARDKITAEIKSAHRAQKQFGEESKKIKDNIEDADELASKMDDVSHSLKAAKKEAGGLEKAGKLGSTFRKIGASVVYATGALWGVTAAIGGVMTLTNNHTAEMVGLAKSYDMSIGRFKAWSGVAAQAGLDGEHVGDLIEELSNKFGEFKVLGEQSSVSDVFGALGLEQSMLDGMSAADQFEFIMGRIEKVSDKQQAASLADQLFGGEGNKIAMYIRNSGKAMNELLEEQNRFNLLTDEGAVGATAYGQSFKNLSSVVTSGWQEISGILGGEMAGEIQSLGDTVSSFVRENKQEIVTGIKSIITASKDLAYGVYTVASSVNTVVNAFGGWQTVGAVLVGLIAGKMVVGIGGMVMNGYNMIKMLGAGRTAMAGFNVVIAANPIGAVAAAVGLLVTSGILLYQNWDKVTAWFSEKLAWFKTEFPNTFGVIKTIFDWSPLVMVINHWQPIMDFFGGLFDGIANIVQSKIDSIIGSVTKVAGYIGKLKFWGNDDSESVVQPPQNVVPISAGSARSASRSANRIAASQSNRGAQAVSRADMGSRGTTVHQSVGDIQIHAAPGQSPQDIARAVHERLGGQRNSALYDLPEVG